MGTVGVAVVVDFIDKLTALYLAAKGSVTSGEGLGVSSGGFGANDKAVALEALGIGTADYDIIALLGPAFRALRNNTDANAFASTFIGGPINAIGVACAAAGTANGWSGVADLDSFAAYHNLTTGTKWQLLFPPDFYEVYLAALGRAPSNFNVYYEVLQTGGGDALGKRVIGTGFSSPASIDDSLYAGGFGRVKATGITGSDVVTVAGNWRKTDGTTATGNGTASVTSSSTFTLTPPFTDALLLGVTNITAAAGLTAGTIYAEAARPSGRTNPPT